MLARVPLFRNERPKANEGGKKKLQKKQALKKRTLLLFIERRVARAGAKSRDATCTSASARAALCRAEALIMSLVIIRSAISNFIGCVYIYRNGTVTRTRRHAEWQRQRQRGGSFRCGRGHTVSLIESLLHSRASTLTHIYTDRPKANNEKNGH